MSYDFDNILIIVNALLPLTVFTHQNPRVNMMFTLLSDCHTFYIHIFLKSFLLVRGNVIYFKSIEKEPMEFSRNSAITGAEQTLFY